MRTVSPVPSILLNIITSSNLCIVAEVIICVKLCVKNLNNNIIIMYVTVKLCMYMYALPDWEYSIQWCVYFMYRENL